mmetsp:Transcript_35713/g.43030  ORF Transcript_35713/g.43030 Transcript_35713/m.43030 type:complete len:97 (+) Transcript_35713:198-488(+)
MCVFSLETACASPSKLTEKGMPTTRYPTISFVKSSSLLESNSENPKRFTFLPLLRNLHSRDPLEGGIHQPPLKTGPRYFLSLFPHLKQRLRLCMLL